MGVLWVEDGGGVATFGNGKPAVLCDKCPCGEQWVIVRLCGCYGECDVDFNALPPVVGTLAWVDGSPTTPLLIDGVQARKLTVLDHGHAANGGGLVDPAWFVVPVPIMKPSGTNEYEPIKIQAVQFQAPAAPFDGTISAKVFIDGVEDVGARWTGDCEDGVATNCGASDWDNASDQPLLKVDAEFDEPGMHRVVVEIVWTATATGAKAYRAAQVVVWCHLPCYAEDQPLSFEPPSEGPLNYYPGPDDFWIIPKSVADAVDYISDCPWIYAEGAYRWGHSAHTILGPYDVRADAEYVLLHWGGAIAAHYRDCNSCIEGCGNGGENNCEFYDSEGNSSGVVVVDGDGGTGVPASCANGWMIADAWGGTIEGAGSLTFWVKYPGGNWETIGTATNGNPVGLSGYAVPPCSEYRATYTNTTGTPATVTINCTWAPVFTPPVVDCESIAVAFASVPENSAELREWEESQQAVNRLLAELPERMV